VQLQLAIEVRVILARLQGQRWHIDRYVKDAEEGESEHCRNRIQNGVPPHKVEF
jgi:hypothetical protein